MADITHRWTSTDLTWARCGVRRPAPEIAGVIPTAEERAQRREDRQGNPTCTECAALLAEDASRFNAEHLQFLDEMGPFLR